MLSPEVDRSLSLQSGQTLSAPQEGADFSFTNATQKHLHEKPVVFRNGLVDPRSVYAYADRCHCNDLQNPNSKGRHAEEGHHLYFPIKDFKNNWALLPIRMLRNARTNHIMMLSCQEDLYHEETENSVPHASIDVSAAETFLEEDEWLVNYASSSLMVAEMQKKLEGIPLLRLERARMAARLALAVEMLERDKGRIPSITVMDSAIVTGALVKYLEQQPEAQLGAMVDARIAEDGMAIPSRIYGVNALRNRAAVRLWPVMSAQNWLVRKLVIPPTPEARTTLQTGVSGVE